MAAQNDGADTSLLCLDRIKDRIVFFMSNYCGLTVCFSSDFDFMITAMTNDNQHDNDTVIEQLSSMSCQGNGRNYDSL